MSIPVTNLTELLCTMQPVLNDGVYVFSVVPFDTDLADIKPVATFREQEGLTIIAEESSARAAKLDVKFRAAWITLNVHSDLSAVGLTAAFATALGQAGISCNVIAAAHHDHIFVPIESGQAALKALRELQQRSESTRNSSASHLK